MNAVGRERVREELRRSWRQEGIYTDLTVGEAITLGATQNPDSAIVFAAVDGDTVHATLRGLHLEARKLAATLREEGVDEGSIVAMQGPADGAGTELLQALWLLGAVIVPLVATAGAAEIGHIVRETGASHYVSPPEWRGTPFATQAVTHSEEWGLDCVLTLGADAPRGARPLQPATEPVAITSRPSPSSVACVLYTSGSTALPKGVQHTHETLLAGLTAGGSNPAMRGLATFPAGHIASLLGLLRPLAVGGTTVVMDRWSARNAAALIEEFKLTNSSGTPFFLSTLLDEADRNGRDISSLQAFLVGAASVPPSLVERATERGIISWRTYGSTEHPGISSGLPSDPVEKRMGTDGRVAPMNTVRLVDEGGNDVGAGDEGEIVARGPKQFLGYQDAALNDEAFLDGWFRTGDLGRFDSDGYLTITDRVKDIIIRGGENISAREVEDVLASHATVAEVAVCAAPDDVWGEVVCAFVRPIDGAVPTTDELAKFAVYSGLAPHKSPQRVVLVDDFPRTAAGKVKKQELRRDLFAQRPK